MKNKHYADMNSKYSDDELMAFADKETSAERSMDILGDLLKGNEESKILARRVAVFIDTRNALVNNIIKENK
jgi:hypothetical protein